jgi:hypothetical protein
MKNNYFLGLGPMSLNIINSIDKFAKLSKKKIMLICSRNQIETDKLGGGYVNNFNTKSFSDYIKKKKNNNLILCRDHSGPYKKDGIKNNLLEEIKNCKDSLKDDITNDFKIIHIDTSECKKEKYEIAEELINFCNSFALQNNKKILFEFGCEDHGVLTSLKKFKADIKFISKFKNKHFIVCQTGSYVRSVFQIGQFDIDTIKQMKGIANAHGLYLKEHNCDYLTAPQIRLRKEYKIDAINVAPELGYIQSSLIYYLSKRFGLNRELNNFFKLVLNKNKWKKWEYNNENSTIKFLSSAHYYYTTEQYLEINEKLKKYTNFQKQLDIIIFENLKKYFS